MNQDDIDSQFNKIKATLLSFKEKLSILTKSQHQIRIDAQNRKDKKELEEIQKKLESKFSE